MKTPSIFGRVVRSYSMLEKVLSVLFIAALLYFGGSYIISGKFMKGSTGKEGVYTEGFQASILRINPVYADLNEPDRDVSRLVFRGLTKYDSSTQKIVGDIADVTISEDKLKYTFVIKNNITWHDGEIVDANDVIYTFQTVIQSPEFQNPVLKANFEGVVIAKIDDKTIDFTLTAPNSFFITNTTVGLLPEHILKDVPIYDLINHDFNKNPVGNGPYKINVPLSTTITGVTQVLLEKYDLFYEGAPELKQIRFFGYPTRTELVANINSLNALPKVTEEAVSAVSSDSRFGMYGYSLPQYTAVFMNMDNGNLKSLKVRQALQKAIHKDTFLEQIPDTIRVETPVLGLNQEEWKYVASMDESKKFLDEAGYKEVREEVSAGTEPVVEGTVEEVATVEAGEVTEVAQTPVETVIPEETGDTRTVRKNPGGQILEFRLVARLYPEGSYKYNEMNTVISYLEKQWTTAGIKINIELYDATTLQEKIQTRDYDLLLFGQSLGYNQDLYGYWHSTQTGENGLNLSNYKSFAVDTLIEQIRTTFDDKEKENKSKELAKIIQADVPALFLYRPVYYYASDGKVKGLDLQNMAFPADRFCRIGEWFLN
jgi:peptide/nickel transport system substrate-binding protein